MSARRIIEDIFTKPTVFRRKDVLYPEYIPSYLPHREKQLKKLAEIFRNLILNPGEVSQRALVVGDIGTGKTVTTRSFGKELKGIAKAKNIDLKYIHINCHKDRTLYEVVIDIAKQAEVPIPSRGFSAQEVFEYFLKYLERNKSYALIALDEFNYFIETAGNDAVYFLIRIYDENPEQVKRINYIFIVRNLSTLYKLDTATYSYLIKNIVEFKPYTSSELIDILRMRSEEAFHPGSIDEKVIKYIADLEGYDRGGSGNARVAIETLLLAGEAADQEGSKTITLEHVRRARGLLSSDIVNISDSLYYLNLHELLLLKSIINVLKKIKTPYTTMGSVEKEYMHLCSIYGYTHRKHTQVYEYIMNMSKMGIIETRPSGKGTRGRTTLIGIGEVPLEPLEQKIDELLKVKSDTR